MKHVRTYSRMTSRRSLVVGSFASIAAIGIGVIPARCAGKFYPGTRILDLDLGGLDRATGARALRERFAHFVQHPLTLVFGDLRWTPTLDALGVTVDFETMLDDAMKIGRDEGAVNSYASFLAGEEDRPVRFAYTIDHARLVRWLASVSAEIDVIPQDAQLMDHDGDLRIVDEQPGRRLDADRALRDIRSAVESGRFQEIELQTTVVTPQVSADDLAAARERAWRLIGEPVTFTHEDVPYPISKEDLAAALVIDEDGEASLNTDVLLPRFQAIADVVATPPRNVLLGWDGGLYVVAKDIDGAEVDLVAMGAVLRRAAEGETRVEALPMNRIPAAAREDNLNELGLESHIGMGSSSFAGSSEARAENVRVSARNISYKLVAPGEMFSFNTMLGPISEDAGFIAGTIIQGDWVASDIGGGVCQASTTVFRAAVNAGFRFTEWHAHSWRLDFYELDGTDPGHDAAIYQPNTEWEQEQDLRFENTLESWLLLQLVIDSDQVSAHFYGKDPGLDVELHPARVSDPIPPGEPIERANTELAPGERRMVQQATPGYHVAVRRIITDASGTVVADGDFVSDYVPQPEAWEIGPN